MRNIKYHFGRINILAERENKEEFLWSSLIPEKEIKRHGFCWNFFEIEREDSGLGLFYYGYLVKFKKISEEEIAVPERHKLTLEEIKNRTVAKSPFFIHVHSGLIAYHPVSNHIENSQFCNIFKKIFEDANLGFFVNIEIQPVTESYEFFEAIKRFSLIKKVAIYLHPANPNISDTWKRTHERLTELNADSFHEEYKSSLDDGGLKIVEDTEITSKIRMAEDGYGHVDATGYIDGEPTKVSTIDKQHISYIDTRLEPIEVLSFLIEKFQILIAKFKDEA
ncbi:MAG: hypothetical protein HQ528_11735 [Candidatus Marinimicrobia bacterium]|nr:hypothetical protein [Candidatus Neomarinimicrobiota bacterium]